MSAPAVIQGTYTDLKVVRSRKVCQIVVEIPLETSKAFVDAFGMPNPGSETWVALARLNAGVTASEEGRKERRRFNEMPRAQQAALACNDPVFQAFIQEEFGGQKGADAAADAVRLECEVDTRAELDRNRRAAARWDDLHGRYLGWRAAA